MDNPNRKILLVAFNGEMMCAAHVLLNALDMKNRGFAVKVVFEGSATRLIGEFKNEKNPFANLYQQVIQMGLLDCVCKACAAKMGSLEEAVKQDLPLCSEMKGHPSLARYIEEGYRVITF